MDNIVVILAGGLGKRMNSDIPKVCHLFNNIPMIVRVYRKALLCNPTKILIVVGKYKDIIKNTLNNFNITENEDYHFVIQEQALGTGHAVLCTRELLLNFPKYNVLILCGDVPLIDEKIILNMTNCLYDLKCVTTIYDNPKSYGRIIRNNNNFERIVEFKDCNEHEKNIKEVNCGIYTVLSDHLIKYLPEIKNENSQKEYYLTDIVEIIKTNENIDIKTLIIEKENQYKVEGVNSQDELILLQQNYND